MRARALCPDVYVEIIEIGHEMNRAGLPKPFIAAAVEAALDFEGVYDLMKFWAEEDDQNERDAAVADIQDMIDECGQKKVVEGAAIRFDDLDGIAKNIRAFKDGLRLIVDQRGGIGRLAGLTGIPQPSLSRFFGSASMPRRVTLLKIALALKLNEIQIATQWLR